MKKIITPVISFVRNQSKRTKIFALAALLVLLVSGTTFALTRPEPQVADNHSHENRQQSSSNTPAVASSTREPSPHPSESKPAPTPKPPTAQNKPAPSSTQAPKKKTLSLTKPVANNNLRVTGATFMTPRVYCENGVQLANIVNMRVLGINIPEDGFTITWNWESSMPELYDYDNFVQTTTFSALQVRNNMLTLPDSQVFPWLYSTSSLEAPTMPAHSLRIHILTPNDAYTEWFNVPAFTPGTCG